jgi:sugar lactone lactonase YvrE
VDAMMHGMQLFNRQGELLLSVGNQGQDAGEFWLPSGICITKDNTIYVADAYNKRVQVFRYIGPEE